MPDIIKPKPLSLYKALDIGYLRDEAKQKKKLKKFGYRLVPELTTREHVVAFNPASDKLLYISNGTDFSNRRDVQNDVLGAIGKQQSSARMAEERSALLKAKQEFNPKATTLVSHSLGSQYTNYIAGGGDSVIQYNPYYTAGAKSRPNVHNYRAPTDVVSAFAPKANTTILKAKSVNPVSAHNIDNLKEAAIFV